MVGTELVMELGGASMPDGCSRGSGGGGPVSDERKQNTKSYNASESVKKKKTPRLTFCMLFLTDCSFDEVISIL